MKRIKKVFSTIAQTMALPGLAFGHGLGHLIKNGQWAPLCFILVGFFWLIGILVFQNPPKE